MSIAYAQTERLRKLRGDAERIAKEVAAPNADAVDRDAAWPRATFEALSEAGMLGLHVPVGLGGHGQGLTGLLLVTEAIASGCSSSGLCYGMHNVATAVLAARATPDHEERFLKPIARGEHLTTLAVSEAGTGSHLYLTETSLVRNGDEYVADGAKQFVTNGSFADSYVISTLSSTEQPSIGEFNMLVVEGDRPGLEWGEPWQGFGMRGNSARTLRLNGARVPTSNLLGAEGDQIWYMFEVVVPYFVMAMTGTYLGIAQAALEEAINHVRTRRYAHNGEALADSPIIQRKVAEMWGAVERSRRLVYHAARLGDEGDVGALPAILTAKAEVDETVVYITNEAMTLGGGAAYRANSRLARLLRDGRAGEVMSPTTDLLRSWAGRSLLGLPVL